MRILECTATVMLAGWHMVAIDGQDPVSCLALPLTLRSSAGPAEEI